MMHKLVVFAGKIDWDWLDGEIAPLYSDQGVNAGSKFPRCAEVKFPTCGR